ncbi:phage tail protein [Sphaerotilus sp.]|uniref:phage tail protein n=1 Tax=Sphaerotilus sp. TaxID=2093942 RepID=UPI0034E25C3C
MDSYLGMVCLFGYDFQVHNWMKCDGQTLSIQQYTALFALLGTNYGGNGQTTFCLPKMAAPMEGMSYQICIQGIFPSRD